MVDACEQHASPSDEEVFAAALSLTKLTNQGMRFAILVQSPPDRRLEYLENIVTNHGGKLRYFTDKDQASAWLLRSPHA